MLMFVVLVGVMVWTWAASRGEREAILEREPALRDKLIQEDLLGAQVAVHGHWLSDWRADDERL